MAKSLAKVLLHIVYSTKNRVASIKPDFRHRLHAYIAATCTALDATAYKVGGVEDHIHIACCLPRTISIADLMEQIKVSSSRWVKDTIPGGKSFAWQNGYGAFSLGISQLPTLYRYIANQEHHHTRHGYKQEVVHILKRYEIDYDERYLWD